MLIPSLNRAAAVGHFEVAWRRRASDSLTCITTPPACADAYGGGGERVPSTEGGVLVAP